MAQPWPRETFVIPGVAGQVRRTINMIKIDDTFRPQLLAFLNGATTDQGPNPMPAIGPIESLFETYMRGRRRLCTVLAAAS